MRWLPALALLGALVCTARADEHSHKYTDGEEVVLWFSTVGPYDNLQESYDFLSLPFCVGTKEVHHRHESLGEALLGVQLVNAGVDIKFKEDVLKTEFCTKEMSRADVNDLREAVQNKYFYQMFVDDLPLGAYVGEAEGDNISFFTHRHFNISYRDDRIIHVKITTGDTLALPEKGTADPVFRVPFTYSVTFTETDEPFENRFNKYLDRDFFEHKIHWFSIANSFMMVLFLFGLVALIMIRTLKRDYARYDSEQGLLDLDRDLADEYGWKQVHGDVFRAPSRLSVLSAFIGTGVQLVVLAISIIVSAMAGDMYLERATILTATIFLYAFTSFLSGYVSAATFSSYSGRNWVRTMFLTAAFWPATVAIVANIVNFAAISIQSTRAIPFGSMVAIIAIWLLVVFPLTFIGYVVGKNFTKLPNFPCRVNPIPRPIPDKIWYTQPAAIIGLAGLFPFASIFIELYFVFQSFWTLRIYYVYGFLFLVFVMLVLVTACVAIVSTYLLLNNEDHRWHWISFLSSGSTALYVFGYSIYYFVTKTKMHGFFQTTWYFGYIGLLCVGLFLLLGTVGHWAADKFVSRIYRNVKID
ncbi:uncharacterized protein EV422DRAFT_361721 [Fimicolochytrium jonesii]|uniref:uncharacterized protein n=1 Tax=Fimicolochytrium jonesii TaxID=1396493 RepID=UPI0022FDB764|nr:uncharacterized protein EV422DRAFT_361721 [Fimicolochytrium jonesii]KAI8823608.1 hypothetical protein EV422DRAFT_361721 [Fimicolochytrium jonesii]